MAGELTVLNSNTSIQEGGLGVDLSSKLFKLKPATLTLVQPQSTVEGATKGNLRIAETGQEFNEMFCTLLVMPQESRQWYIGEQGEMNRIPENLMCFSTDMIRPHEKARIPQAPFCNGCAKSDWTPYREYSEANGGKGNKKLIPPCEASYRVFLIDTIYQLPLKMFIRSKAKTTFEQGMQNVARVIAMAKAQTGKMPNIFDVKFKLTTKLIQSGAYKYYVPVFSDPKLVSEEEKAVFGAIYTNFTAAKEHQAVEEDVVQSAQTEINKAVDGEYVNEDKEIII